jgi:hypothetical protein
MLALLSAKPATNRIDTMILRRSSVGGILLPLELSLQRYFRGPIAGQLSSEITNNAAKYDAKSFMTNTAVPHIFGRTDDGDIRYGLSLRRVMTF